MFFDRARRVLVTCILVWGVALGAGAGGGSNVGWVPTLNGRVNDTAEVLSTSDRERISAILKDYEMETHHQVAVLTIATLDGEAIEAFSLRTFNTWGLGNKGMNDGILITLANERAKGSYCTREGNGTVHQ